MQQLQSSFVHPNQGGPGKSIFTRNGGGNGRGVPLTIPSKAMNGKKVRLAREKTDRCSGRLGGMMLVFFLPGVHLFHVRGSKGKAAVHIALPHSSLYVEGGQLGVPRWRKTAFRVAGERKNVLKKKGRHRSVWCKNGRNTSFSPSRGKKLPAFLPTAVSGIGVAAELLPKIESEVWGKKKKKGKVLRCCGCPRGFRAADEGRDDRLSGVRRRFEREKQRNRGCATGGRGAPPNFF